MGWKSKKDGTHFNTDKTIRSSEPNAEVNIEIDNNSDDFSEGVRKDFEDLEFTPRSNLLKSIFGDKIPNATNRNHLDLQTGKLSPSPLIHETDDLETMTQSFLTDDGIFINAGTVTEDGYRITHDTILSYLTDEPRINSNSVGLLSGKLNLVRIGDAGNEVYMQVANKLSPAQLRKINQTIKDAEYNDKSLEFDVGTDDLLTRFSTDNKKEFYEKLRELDWIPQ